MRNKVLFFIAVITFSACKDDGKVGKYTEKDFFDLRTFISQEIDFLSKSNCTVYKEGQIGDDDDAVQVDLSNYDWDKDLEVLSDFQINKSAWYDYFNIDTISEQIEGIGSVTSIHYTNQSNHIPIKSLKFSFLADDFSKPILIEGERKVKNWMFHTEQKIYYTGSAYRLEGYQKILWLEEKNFNITTIYNCPNESN